MYQVRAAFNPSQAEVQALGMRKKASLQRSLSKQQFVEKVVTDIAVILLNFSRALTARGTQGPGNNNAYMRWCRSVMSSSAMKWRWLRQLLLMGIHFLRRLRSEKGRAQIERTAAGLSTFCPLSSYVANTHSGIRPHLPANLHGRRLCVTVCSACLLYNVD